ncbi:MAG: type IV pilus secretin PilQ [Thermodesulfobacteriota bacterium]|nr:type IV pilus secretin PilQ [Thermodesulfobacteriota bacterium]
MMRNQWGARMGRRVLWICLAALCVSWGCAKDRSAVQQQDFLEKWQARAEASKGYSPGPLPDMESPVVMGADKEKNNAIETIDVKPGYKLGAEDGNALIGLEGLPDTPVTIHMTDTDIAVILRALTKAAGKNIIIGAGVSGRANINAEGVPWKEAFAGLLRTHGLTYNRIGDTLRIKTLADIQQDFAIENAYRKQQGERSVTQVFFLKYSEAADVANLLKPVTARAAASAEGVKEAQQSVVVDKQNNAVIVHAALPGIEQCAALVRQIDRPTRQVLIEAHIVETSKDTARQLGIQWGGVAKDKQHSWFTGATEGPAGQTLFDADGVPVPANPSGNWAANFPANVGNTGLSLGYIYQDLGQSLIAAQLTALEEDGKLNILSSPSITTLDNSAAVIESGRDVPFQTVEDNEVNIEWKKAVLSLAVTPHIIDEKTLRVKIKTHKDELDWSNATLTDGNPTIITKNAETEMILFDGQTTVIGGLNKQSSSQSQFGVPLLGRIPILGFFFRSTNRSNDMEEVLIFITPHILEPYTAATGAGIDTEKTVAPGGDS